MSKYKIFLHIGLGRSGSDFLQKKIFSNLSNINYIDRYNSKTFDKFRINLFYNPFFNIKNKTKFKVQRKSLISSENFFNPDYKLNELQKKIRAIDKNPNIILVLREPFSHLVSTYKYSVQNGSLWRKIDDIFDFNITRRARNMAHNIIFYKNFYNYKLLINFLREKFERVDIYKFEKIFYSYETMYDFLKLLEKKYNFKYKSSFSKKNFYKINSSFNNTELAKKRILNFKKENRIFNPKNFKNSYFENYYSLNFKKKFINSLNFNYEKLF